jgi:hypothetical protein
MKGIISKKNYIINQIKKTNKKNYENYVVTGIIHGVKDLDLEFITQQFVEVEGKYYLTDLYFPQLKLHVEVYEPDHINHIEHDEKRSSEIVKTTQTQIELIDFYKRDDDDNILENEIDDLKSVDNQIDDLVCKIKSLSKNIKKTDDWFKKYSAPQEFYKNKGILDVEDNPTFRIAAQAANLLGQGYEDNAQITWVNNLKKYNGYSMWCPKVYNSHEDWVNTFCMQNGEEVLIQQCNKKEVDLKTEFENQINNKFAHFPRITFPYLRDNLGNYGYKFRGIYKLDKKSSSLENGIVYKRIETVLKLK